jgi:hypothetical protein
MINSLYIPINYNETKAFIASGSNFGNEYLNIEEFSNLIFSESENFDIGPYKISSEKNLFDEKEESNLINKITENNKDITDDKNIAILKDFISQRIITLNKNMKELNKEKYSFLDNENNDININLNKCTYDKFLKGILSLSPSETFCKDEYIKHIFNEYKDKDNLIDMRLFCEKVYEKNSKEYLTKLKDNLTDISKVQLNQKKETLKKYVSQNKNKKHLIYEKKFDLDEQILIKKNALEKEKIEEQKQLTEINSTVPSTKWIHHVYDNRKEHYNILNRAEHALSAKPNLKHNIFRGNTRFGANPPWKNTAEILIGDKNAATYINEKDRFNLDRDIGKDDKIRKEQSSEGDDKPAPAPKPMPAPKPQEPAEDEIEEAISIKKEPKPVHHKTDDEFNHSDGVNMVVNLFDGKLIE